MKLKAKYKFEQFDTEITNPTLTVNPIVKEVNPMDMTIACDITLEVTGAKFGVFLEDVKVQNLNYDPNNAQELIDRVVTRLNDFKV